MDLMTEPIKREMIMAGLKILIARGIVPREMTEAECVRYARAVDEVQMVSYKIMREGVAKIARSN
jgi:hypothetical protein